ncbi:dethiobiotin synthase [Bacillus kexueae]|uniref:dethiobiotin synthase n=1 Tax=Aeribacillus kexueae TaxID=2078952 RepID=UPI001FAFAE97|nr:dethiobiotin synthase [Bacillus kexueae]
MGQGVFITGTSTEIGKTYVTKHLVKELRERGVNALPYKPIQTGCVRHKEGYLVAEDVEQYVETANLPFKPSQLCTYFLEKPASPHLASTIEQVELNIDRIVQHFNQLLTQHDIVLVEGAGGLVVPLKEDPLFMTKDLIQQLNIPIVIVVPPHLGSINHALLTVEYARNHSLSIAGIVFNRVSLSPTDIEKDNMRFIEKVTKLPILGVIHEAHGEKKHHEMGFNIDALMEQLNVNKLLI